MWLIFLLLFNSTVWAVQVDEVIVTKGEALTKGTLSDATFGPMIVIPVDAKGAMRIALDLDQTVLEDETTDLTLELWVNNGIFYVLNAAAHYVGGKHMNKEGKPQTEPPGFWVNSSEYLGKSVRVRVVPAPTKTVIAGATTEIAK